MDATFVPDQEQGLVAADYLNSYSGMEIASSLRCHPGRTRTTNQDRVAQVRVPLGELFLVADGVGGQAGGGEAAASAIAEFARFLSAAPSTADPLSALQQAAASVTARIGELRQSNARYAAMASTVVLALVQERSVYIGHLGDSRAYLARSGKLSLLTHDHSVVRKLVDRGIIAEQDAESHPSAHILTRSLGEPNVSLEIAVHSLENGDVLLLCTDGLWAYIDKELMTNLVTRASSVPETANALLEGALDGGGHDNIGMVLIHVLREKRSESRNPFRRVAARPLLFFAVLGIALLLALAAFLAMR